MDGLLAQSTSAPVSTQWVMIALGGVTLLYIVFIRPAFKKKKDPLEPKPIAGNLSRERTVERQMQNLLVELSEMARQMNAHLDTRTQKLQMLIDDADQRIAELKRLQEAAPPVRNEIAWTAPPPAAALRKLPPEPVDEQHQRVYDLADQGLSAGEIAKRLNQPRGEVELIMDLRPKVGA